MAVRGVCRSDFRLNTCPSQGLQVETLERPARQHSTPVQSLTRLHAHRSALHAMLAFRLHLTGQAAIFSRAVVPGWDIAFILSRRRTIGGPRWDDDDRQRSQSTEESFVMRIAAGLFVPAIAAGLFFVPMTTDIVHAGGKAGGMHAAGGHGMKPMRGKGMRGQRMGMRGGQMKHGVRMRGQRMGMNGGEMKHGVRMRGKRMGMNGGHMNGGGRKSGGWHDGRWSSWRHGHRFGCVCPGAG